jgi:hypothetical protein
MGSWPDPVLCHDCRSLQSPGSSPRRRRLQGRDPRLVIAVTQCILPPLDRRCGGRAVRGSAIGLLAARPTHVQHFARTRRHRPCRLPCRGRPTRVEAPSSGYEPDSSEIVGGSGDQLAMITKPSGGSSTGRSSAAKPTGWAGEWILDRRDDGRSSIHRPLVDKLW